MKSTRSQREEEIEDEIEEVKPTAKRKRLEMALTLQTQLGLFKNIFQVLERATTDIVAFRAENAALRAEVDALKARISPQIVMVDEIPLDLPRELMLQIFRMSDLDKQELRQISRVSKSFHQFVNKHSLITSARWPRLDYTHPVKVEIIMAHNADFTFHHYCTFDNGDMLFLDDSQIQCTSLAYLGFGEDRLRVLVERHPDFRHIEKIMLVNNQLLVFQLATKVICLDKTSAKMQKLDLAPEFNVDKVFLRDNNLYVLMRRRAERCFDWERLDKWKYDAVTHSYKLESSTPLQNDGLSLGRPDNCYLRGDTLYAASSDSGVKVWNILTGQALFECSVEDLRSRFKLFELGWHFSIENFSNCPEGCVIICAGIKNHASLCYFLINLRDQHQPPFFLGEGISHKYAMTSDRDFMLIQKTAGGYKVFFAWDPVNNFKSSCFLPCDRGLDLDWRILPSGNVLLGYRDSQNQAHLMVWDKATGVCSITANFNLLENNKRTPTGEFVRISHDKLEIHGIIDSRISHLSSTTITQYPVFEGLRCQVLPSGHLLVEGTEWPYERTPPCTRGDSAKLYKKEHNHFMKIYQFGLWQQKQPDSSSSEMTKAPVVQCISIQR